MTCRQILSNEVLLNLLPEAQLICQHYNKNCYQCPFYSDDPVYDEDTNEIVDSCDTCLLDISTWDEIKYEYEQICEQDGLA